MRGKNILWISWIAMLLVVGMVNLTAAPVGDTMIVVQPNYISGLMPGDKFWVNFDIINGKDVYAFQLKLKYAPPSTIIAALDPAFPWEWDGGYLGGLGPSIVAGSVFKVAGEVFITGTRLGDIGGVSGNGTLAKVEFIVIEAGESPLDLVDTILFDEYGNELDHQTRDGFYDGPIGNLIRVNTPGGRSKDVGDSAIFNSKVINKGDVPLYMYVRFDMIREHDMELLRIGAGQAFTGFGPPLVDYLYINSYAPWIERDWANVGASLFGEPDGDYASSPGTWDGTTGFPITSFYGFEDLTLGPGQLIGNVQLEMYTQYVGGGDDNLDLDCYNGHLDWLGSEFGYADWGYHTPRWIGEDLSDTDPSVMTEAGINDFELLIMYWTADHLPHNEARVDAARLRVEYSTLAPVEVPIFVVPPGEELELDSVLWGLTDYDVGKYHCTATAYFSYGGTIFNRADKTSTFTWWVDA